MYKIAICDDNYEDLKRLKRILLDSKECPENIEILEYDSGEECLYDIPLDLNVLILDIQLTGMDGNEVAKHIRNISKELILVFCTAVVLPSVDSFVVQPFRYIMKYFQEEEISKNFEDILKEMKSRKESYFLNVKAGRKFIQVNLNDIIYIAIHNRVAKICLDEREKEKIAFTFESPLEAPKELITNRKLEDLYEELKNRGFEYAHNSYIVNMDYVVRIDGCFIKLKNGMELNLSRSRRITFNKRFSEYLGLKYRR
jgi:DNA-binding LytR/AlgR family response regulator